MSRKVSGSELVSSEDDVIDIDFSSNGEDPHPIVPSDRIVFEFGYPFQRTRSGFAINQPFFARLWGSNRLALFDQASGSFYHYIPERGLFEKLRENEIRRLITEDLFAEAQSRGEDDVGSKITASCQRSMLD